MDDKLNYRGFVIVAQPLKLAEGVWTHRGYVQKDVPGLRETQELPITSSSQNREEAVKVIFASGRNYIDRELA